MRLIYRWCVCVGAALSLLTAANLSYGDPPPISDPEMRAPAGAMPGAFPETVTAANVNAAPIPGSELGGSGSNNIKVTFPAAGPIKWTESRHNEGDIAMMVGPFDPDDPSYFPPNDFVDDYKPLDGQPFANTTLAWRANRDHGALLATVRHNGVNNMDTTFLGDDVGITHGVAYFNSSFGQGWGYRMDDGVFANGGNNSADLQMGFAGADLGDSEAVFNTAVAMFPYTEGWLGAYVDSADNGQATFSSASPNVNESSVNWQNGIATVSLPDVDPLNDGMLFVAPTSGDNDADIAAAFPTTNGWQVTVREDDDSDFTGMTYNGAGFNQLQFLYTPYDATNMIGGHVSGTDGSLVNSGGSDRFQVTRRGPGEYGIEVFDMAGSEALTEDDGMLILSVAGALPGSSTIADRKFLSYEFDIDSRQFIVQSREVTATMSSMSTNAFGDFLELKDVDFYFAYVDFENPLSLTPEVDCDFNDDGDCDINDLNLMLAEGPIADGVAVTIGVNDAFDLNGDSMIDLADQDLWLADAAIENGLATPYKIGDANLDGAVDVTDFNAWNSAKFTSTLQWDNGDFNGDGAADVSDFNSWNTNKFTSSDGVSFVPEPSAMLLSVLAVCGLCRRVRR